jgi:hypothetical protein
MGPSLQNLRMKGLMGKIFRNKELGEASRWRVEVFSVGCVEEALGTVPLCAFCILGKGCSSQERGIFLWKAVEKVQTGPMESALLARRARHAAAWALAFLSFTSASAPKRSA